MIRRDEAEKREIIHLVEHSALSVKKTLDELQVPRSTFYRWYKQYLEDGEEGLEDHRPSPHQIWNRIPQQVKQQVVELALEHPDRSPRQIAWLLYCHKLLESYEKSILLYTCGSNSDMLQVTCARIHKKMAGPG